MPKNPALGITLAVIGCCCTALGYALQKIGHTRAQRYNALRQGDVDAAVGGAGKSSEAEDQDGARHEHDAHHHHKHISYWRFWHFWAGISCLVVGAIFSVVVFGLAGQSELAPMGAVTLVASQLFSRYMLKEIFTKTDLYATILMSAGTTVAIIFGEKSTRDYSIDEIIQLITRPAGWAGTGIMLSVIAGVALYLALLERRPIATLTAKERALDCIGRGFCGGMVGSYTGLTTKSFVEIAGLAVTSGNWSAFSRFEPYGFLVGVVACLYFQLKYLNTGLERHDSARMVPVYQSCLIMGSVFSGWLYFDEASIQSTLSITLFAIGIVVTASGILLLMRKAPPPPADLVAEEAIIAEECAEEQGPIPLSPTGSETGQEEDVEAGEGARDGGEPAPGRAGSRSMRQHPIMSFHANSTSSQQQQQQAGTAGTGLNLNLPGNASSSRGGAGSATTAATAERTPLSPDALGQAGAVMLSERSGNSFHYGELHSHASARSGFAPDNDDGGGAAASAAVADAHGGNTGGAVRSGAGGRAVSSSQPLDSARSRSAADGRARSNSRSHANNSGSSSSATGTGTSSAGGVGASISSWFDSRFSNFTRGISSALGIGSSQQQHRYAPVEGGGGGGGGGGRAAGRTSDVVSADVPAELEHVKFPQSSARSGGGSGVQGNTSNGAGSSKPAGQAVPSSAALRKASDDLAAKANVSAAASGNANISTASGAAAVPSPPSLIQLHGQAGSATALASPGSLSRRRGPVAVAGDGANGISPRLAAGNAGTAPAS